MAKKQTQTNYFENKWNARSNINQKKSIRTEIDQNRLFMYVVRHAVKYLKEVKGYKSVEAISRAGVNIPNYKVPSAAFFNMAMENRLDYLVSEIGIFRFFTMMQVPMIEIMGAAARDYAEECLIKYKFVLEGYSPITQCECPQPQLDWLVQRGSNPFIKQGKLHYSYYMTPVKLKEPSLEAIPNANPNK
jgi:hypothetical protein